MLIQINKFLNLSSSHQKNDWKINYIQQFFNYSLKKLNSFSTNVLNFSNSIRKDLELKNLESKSKNISLGKFLTIGVASILLQFSTANLNTNQDTEIVKPVYTNSQFKNISSVEISHAFSKKASPELVEFIQKGLNNSNPLEKISSYSTKKIYKTPNFVKSLFDSKSQAFTYLLNVAEGKSNKFYRDNLGIAIGYGWNPTRNSKEFNLDIANKIGLDDSQKEVISFLSNNKKINKIPKNLKNFTLTDEQVKKSAVVMMDIYENEFLSVMQTFSEKYKRNFEEDKQIYSQLPFNQQSVMIHMAYKVGGENLSKYKTFYKSLFKYFEKPTQTNLKNVSSNFEYTYLTNEGERIHDVRVEQTHDKFFKDCSIGDKEKVLNKIQQCKIVANISDIKEANLFKNRNASLFS